MPSRKLAFLVYLWLEEPDSWRGSIEHLASGRRLYFHDIAGLVRFLGSWIGVAGRR